MVIEASERLFVDEVGARLVNLGASVEEAAFHLLAHEIHHLDEIERQAACGISSERRGSAFAGAVRSDFPPDWKRALQTLTTQYPDDSDLGGGLLSAAQIANEAAADLVGLHWARLHSPNWKTFAVRLVAFRAADAAAEKRRQKSVIRRRFKKPIAFYDIVSELESVLANSLPQDTQDIYSECWRLAIDKAFGLGAFQDPSRALFRALPELNLPPSLPAAPGAQILPRKTSP